MNDFSADAFWSFSLKLYSRSGIAKWLLQLQDEHGADVNMVLFCCWCGKEGRVPLGDAFFLQTDRDLHEWRVEVVETLRRVRRRLKGQVVGVPGRLTDPLREEVKRLEVEAERISQSVIASRAPPPSCVGGEAAIRSALDAYFKHADIMVTQKIRESFKKLVVESLLLV